MSFSTCPVCQGLIQPSDTTCPICRTPVGAPVPAPLAAGPPGSPPVPFAPPGGPAPPDAAPPPAAPFGAPLYGAPPYGVPPYGPPPHGGPPYGAPLYGAPGSWSPKPKPSRAKVVLIISAVTLIIGIGVLAVSTVLLRRSPYPSSWDPRVADLTSFVERARGLDYKHPVYVDFLTEDEFNKTVTQPDSSFSDDDKQQLQQEVQTFRALGLLQGDVDLVAQSNQLHQSGTLAFYDPRTKHVRVRGTELDVAHKVTLAHELTHALQDQYFDLTRLGRFPTSEEQNAFRTVVEGDAVRVENLYVDQLTDADRQAYRSQDKAGRDAATAGITNVPDVLVASISAPYAFGTPFLSVLEAKGGTTTINDAFDNPPPNEAQIVDPDDFFGHRQVGTPKQPSAPAGTDALSPPTQADEPADDHLGSLAFFMMLSARIDPHQALQALDLWNGDAMVSYRRSGTLCTKVAVAVDDQAAVTTVAPILQQWRDDMPSEADAAVDTVGDGFVITTCDPGPGADVKISGKPSDALALPALRLTIWGSALQGKVPAPKASCIARTFTADFPLDEATSDNVDKGDIQNRISAARDACA